MNNRKVLKYHSWIGLLLGLFLVVMGVTGSILVFQHDIENVLWKEYKEVDNYHGMDIDKGFQTIQEEYPGWDTRLIHFQKGEALIFNLRRPTERLFIFVHPTSGEVIKQLNELTTFTRWLLKFHYSFQAGVAGRFLVFVVGILFFLSLVTGIYLYRKSILKTLLFKTKIIRKNKRVYYSSLHRMVGVWSLLLNLLLVITGTFLAYKVSTSALRAPVDPKTPKVEAPIQQVLADITEKYPDFRPSYIRLPISPDGALTVYGLYDDDPFFYSDSYNHFQADFRTGKITAVTKVQDADIGTKLSSTLIPLHFGQYGGIWSKLLYSFLGLSGPLLSITGFLIWKKTKKPRK